MDDNRIDKILKLQEKVYKAERRQSMVLNNFYSIITIVVVCISIIFYTVYIVPAQDEQKQREFKIKQQQEYAQQRANQIALSHKLNKEQNDK